MWRARLIRPLWSLYGVKGVVVEIESTVVKDRMRQDHNIPESLSAFCSIVSLTAAKTSRMFDVSVACVRLSQGQLAFTRSKLRQHLLWVQIKMCPVHLVEPPEQVLRGAVHVVPTRVVREVVP